MIETEPGNGVNNNNDVTGKKTFRYHNTKFVIYPARIKYKVFEKVVLKVRTTTRVISLDKIYNGVIYFIPTTPN